ncbi:hypothetical protein [Corynebacterium sp.]|uniref:hypothetical protein n=1 Tax=Corynebacterium sp. TaxID=1720 RepID=UPI0025BC7F52|nr:hypothetical protein [Corynebacterium sp.]
MDQMQVDLTDRWGIQWALTGNAPGRPGVHLMGPVGLASPIQVTARQTTSQVGVSAVSWKSEQMEATWKIGFRGDDQPLSETWAMFLRGLTPLVPSTLRVKVPKRGILTCPVVRTSVDPEPDKSPYTRGLKSLIVDIPVTSYQGCWHGETVSHRGPSTLANSGDLPSWPVVQWSGAGASVTAPGIGEVALPDTGGRTAVLETDPAFASRVTVDGVDAPDLWRGMRGRLFPAPVDAHSTARWTFDGCVGRLTSRHSHMWRW